MKKILFTITNLCGGGAEKVFIKVIEKLNKKKYRIDLFLFSEEGIYLEKVKNEKIISFYGEKFHKIRNKNLILKKITSLIKKITWNKLKKIRFIINNLISQKYDIEVAFMENDTSILIANHRTDAKKIAWVHTDLEKHRLIPIEKEREIYREFDKIVCVSNDSKQSFLNLYPEYKDKVEVIYNPIDKEEIITKSKEQVEDIKNNKITLVTAGRLTKVKGYDLLLEAHSQLLKEGLDYNLVILGEGELKPKFEYFIQKNNIEKNTKLLGFKSNPYSYMNQGDIFIMSSRYEGYSLVLAEALTLGKPIISTQCVGTKELLDDGKYGVLVPIEDILALKNAMREMILKKEQREKYSKLAIERSSIFNIEDVMKQIEVLLDAK